MSDYHSDLPRGASVMEWILERMERKCCPQGLNVIAEELRWMGQESMTYEKLPWRSAPKCGNPIQGSRVWRKVSIGLPTRLFRQAGRFMAINECCLASTVSIHPLFHGNN